MRGKTSRELEYSAFQYTVTHKSCIRLCRQWRIQLLRKEGARLSKIVKITDFGLSFTLSFTFRNFVIKKGGEPPLNPPL